MPSEKSQSPPIFILSHPRTGSTLLRWLLDSHPVICSPGELRLGPLCELLGYALALTRDLNHASSQNGGSGPFAEVREIIEQIMTPYRIARGKLRWCDKTPINVEFLALLDVVFPDAQYICLHRHGLDAVRSVVEAGLVPRMPDGTRRDGAALTGTAIARWCAHTRYLIAFEKAKREQVLRVTYEDLTTNPDAELNKIWRFLRVAPCEAVTAAAFRLEHDNGPGDFKICGKSRIEPTHVGAGLTLDLTDVSPRLRLEMLTMLTALGYCDNSEEQLCSSTTSATLATECQR